MCSARDSELLAFCDDQGRTDGGGQAVENVGTQGSVSRQEITELLSRNSHLGGEVLCSTWVSRGVAH